MEVGAVEPRREDVSFTTGVAPNSGPMVPPDCAEGIAAPELENCVGITLD